MSPGTTGSMLARVPNAVKKSVRRWRWAWGGLFLAGLGACGSTEDPSNEPKGDIELENGGGNGDGDGDGDAFTLKPGPLEDGELERVRQSACTGWSFEPELAPSVLQLVIDVSGSMDLPPPGGDETKWAITREALRETVDALPSTISLGAVYYPNRNTRVNCTGGTDPCTPGDPVDPSQCVDLDGALTVDALGPSGSPQRDAFEDSLERANPEGGTPTHDAYDMARSELDASNAPGRRFLLLITDGQPTFLEGCSGSGYRTQPVDEGPIIEAIFEAREAGVHTFVVGSPGSEENADTGDDARPWLSRAALAGGTARDGCQEEGPDFCHFDMSEGADFGASLRSALAEIIGQINSCSIAVPPPPEDEMLDPNAVNLILTPSDAPAEVIGRTSEPECTGGWSYSADQTSIELCEDTCLRVREDASMGIELFFGCQTADAEVR